MSSIICVSEDGGVATGPFPPSVDQSTIETGAATASGAPAPPAIVDPSTTPGKTIATAEPVATNAAIATRRTVEPLVIP
ncbi:MAG: hypothetical protein IPK64_03695 [bacterium]|nr:hypothetical protein [bacterium]